MLGSGGPAGPRRQLRPRWRRLRRKGRCETPSSGSGPPVSPPPPGREAEPPRSRLRDSPRHHGEEGGGRGEGTPPAPPLPPPAPAPPEEGGRRLLARRPSPCRGSPPLPAAKATAAGRRAGTCAGSPSRRGPVCLLPGELFVPTHKKTHRHHHPPSQIWCHRERWNKFLHRLIGCWRTHRQGQQNKAPGASMSSHKHHVCTAKCHLTGHIKNPKQSPEVGSLSLPDADERAGLLYDKSSAPEVFTRRTMMFVLGGSHSSVLAVSSVTPVLSSVSTHGQEKLTKVSILGAESFSKSGPSSYEHKIFLCRT
ncbi:uncharacterized protein [Haliaeetus albicilla]|uniref:uncharacterized protein isoform X1 n=1 Tax=Haliaeetus albicilla TaxID=8969 RepID=UPI0037E99F21